MGERPGASGVGVGSGGGNRSLTVARVTVRSSGLLHASGFLAGSFLNRDHGEVQVLSSVGGAKMWAGFLSSLQAR